MWVVIRSHYQYGKGEIEFKTREAAEEFLCYDAAVQEDKREGFNFTLEERK